MRTLKICLLIFVIGFGSTELLIWTANKDIKNDFPPACKVCHCGKVRCAASCSEENMCAMRCEKECGRKR